MSESIHRGMRIRLFLCLLIVATALPGGISAQERSSIQNVKVIGTARIYKANVATAREQAISECLVSAIDTVVLGMLPLERLIKNFQITNQSLYGNTGEFIQDYKVLAEQKVGDTYRVLVQATVSVAGLEEQLSIAGIVPTKKSPPAVLFFVSEVNLEGELPRFWWGEDLPFFKATVETAMEGIMTQKGFAVIAPGEMAQTIEIGAENNQPDLIDQNAARLGMQFGANIVIVGQSKVERTANVMGADTRSFRATVTVRALGTETGAEIATTTQTDVALNPNEFEGSREALTKAGTLAGEALSEQIATAWQKQSGEHTMVKIMVEGTQNLSNFVLFRKMLTELSGVEGIKLREMSPDTSTLMVDYTGTPKALADALMLKTFESFGINITEVSDEHLRIAIVSR